MLVSHDALPWFFSSRRSDFFWFPRPEQTLAIVQRTMEVLQALMPVESMLESSALGMELLAIASNLYRRVWFFSRTGGESGGR